MNANHDLFFDLVAAAAVGSLVPRDRALLEEHLEGGCPECLALLKSLSAPLEALALALPAARPGRGLKARVLVAVAQAGAGEGGVAGAAPARRSRPVARLAAALLLVAAALGWWRASVEARERSALQARLAACEGPGGGPPPRPAPTPEAEVERFLAAHPGARRLTLVATGQGAPGGRLLCAYDPGGRRAVIAFEGLRAPEGRDLELWTIRGGEPRSEGLLRGDEQGRGALRVENTGDPAALARLAVTLEARGGAPDRQRPAGPVWYAADLR